MSLYPFPPRIPPPVPPKPKVLPPINCELIRTFQGIKTHKKGIPSVSKMANFDSTEESRNSSPKRYNGACSPLKTSPTKFAQVAMASPEPRSITSSPHSPHNSSRFSNAKQRAKGVWMSRRKDSKSDIETVSPPTISNICIDSPTLPEPLFMRHGKQSSASGWRECVFGEVLMSGIGNHNGIPTPLNTENEETKRSMTPPIDPLNPPFLEQKLVPSTLPRPMPSLMEAPVLLEKNRPMNAVSDKDEMPDKQNVFRHRADSVPAVSISGTDRADFQICRPGSADSATIGIISSLPQGMRPSDAGFQIPQNDLASLQRHAKKQSEKFSVLSLKDVDLISRELSQLEYRCEYLRKTRASLRQGRRTLHTRMIAYLRSARSGAFSKDSLLNQEEALSELDIAIVEWENKLERAEQRRMLLKQKLLEHVAAALSVTNSFPIVCEEQMDTPPSTPEKQKSQRQVPDQESITVYALLADVSQEIDRTISCAS
ncbi:Up-regulated during septation-domain-containing protein [Geopyxis carbonaria]|nr:Up-regulated during septation-domain-containing protein [Geopyxis carbonaria]